MAHQLVRNFSVLFDSRSENLFIVLILGFISSIFASFLLWFPFGRELPTISAIPSFDNLSYLIHSFISSLLLIVLALSVLLQKHRNKLISIFLLLLMLSVSLDILRIQPWVFYYSIMLFTFLVYSKKKETYTLQTLQLIMILIYIWSGIQKLNYNFFSTTFSSIIQPLLINPSGETLSLISKIAIIAPITEILFGLGLAFKKSRKISVVILVGMHLFILAMLGPLGKDINAVVWPWNISFIFFLILLFWNQQSISLKDLLNKPSYYNGFIILLLGLMPLFSFYNAWPKYFSGALYSGNKITAELYFSDQFKNRFSYDLKKLTENDENKTTINNWALNELNVSAYPSKVYALNVYEKLCKDVESELDIIMVLKSEPHLLTGKKESTTYFCDSIQK